MRSLLRSLRPDLSRAALYLLSPPYPVSKEEERISGPKSSPEYEVAEAFAKQSAGNEPCQHLHPSFPVSLSSDVLSLYHPRGISLSGGQKSSPAGLRARQGGFPLPFTLVFCFVSLLLLVSPFFSDPLTDTFR